VAQGATRKEVIQILGWPTSTSMSGNKEILSYPECDVFFNGGRVFKLVFKSPDKRLKLWKETTSAQAAAPNLPTVRPVAPTSPAVVVRPPARAAVQPYIPPDQSAQVVREPVDPLSAIKATVVKLAVIFGGIGLLLLVLRGKSQDWDGFHHTISAKRKGGPLVPPALNPKPDAPAAAAPVKVRKPDSLLDGWSLSLLKDLEWHRFEIVVAAYESALGHDARLTNFGADGGIDVKIYDKATDAVTRIIQCKAYNSRVKVDLVRSFYGVMAHEKITNGTYYTTESFTDDAESFAQGKNLELISGPTLVARIRQLELPVQIKLFDIAVEGDYMTPTCASCGIKMRKVEARKGSAFWGCPNYPKCTTRLTIARE
jgi:restriction system protein